MTTKTIKALILTTFYITIFNSNVLSEEKIKLGISAPLTGVASNWGDDLKRTLIFANEKLGNNKYELIFEDDKCTTKDAVTVVKKLIDIEKVDYIMGYACSGSAMATAPILQSKNILTMVLVAAANKISDTGDHIFRTVLKNKNFAEVLYQHISKKHEKLAIISEETDFAQDLLNSFVDLNLDNRIKLYSESFFSDSTDFRTMLIKINKNKPEAIFINAQSETTFLANLKQLRQLNIQIPVYGAFMPASKIFLDSAGDLSEGIEFVDMSPIDDSLNSHGKKIYKEFIENYGELDQPSGFIPSYEGFRALDEAIQSNQDPIKFLTSKNFNGLAGKWSFDDSGQIRTKGIVIRRIKNKKYKTIYSDQ